MKKTPARPSKKPPSKKALSKKATHEKAPPVKAAPKKAASAIVPSAKALSPKVSSQEASSVKVSPKNTSSDRPTHIVTVGASAGGLEAMTEFLLNLSPTTGMAFIYVQHLSPEHKSILTTLLSRSTKMKVQEVTNRVYMKPNNLYVVPPDKEMLVLDGHIKLMPRIRDSSVHLPIDKFFASLAEKHKEEAIGVILSGSASDGTRGLLAIKAAGGLTFAQDASAKFNSMPQSAINAGAVDFILPPADIAREITRISKYDYVKRDVIRAETGIADTDPDLKSIVDMLLRKTGIDFSSYKMPTIKRRILRRMLLNQISSLKDYVKFAGRKNDEITILHQDLLINVTTFFRDTDAHEYLKTTLLPKILKNKAANEKLRIWIPACSTGEEAYSIAMTILEVQGPLATNTLVQIFASDLSLPAITKARIGEYAKHDLVMVSPNRLQRFYTKTGNKYRIAKVVRDMCIFAPHNVLSDPPFSRVDFISCCNLFIYLDTAAQKRALATFHYALNEGGYLMLGKSETIGSSGHLFNPISKKFKIYLRKNRTGTMPRTDFVSRIPQVTISDKSTPSTKVENSPAPLRHFESDIDALLLSRYVPASVVINHSMDILQFRGETDIFLRHSTGKASLNILKLAPPEIAFELRHAVLLAIKTKQAVRRGGIEIKDNPTLRVVTVEIIPLALETDEPLLLIIFTKPELIETILKEGKSNSHAKDRRIRKLEEEILATRADMTAFTQEQEAITEELQSANEEVVSSNEELQSVNEELETSKEEIESTNEELTTTVQELQTRNDLLNESYEYAEAILANIHEPMIVLDKDLRVVSANNAFYKKFTLTADDVEGVLLYDVGNKEWDIPALRELLEDILPKNEQLLDFEVIHTFPRIGEKIMLLNASRIIQKVHREKLILLAIADITDMRSRDQENFNREKELLANQKQQLRIAVEQATIQLKKANEDLEERNEDLVNKNKELESFTYIASHDLQEPLRSIQIMADFILVNEKANLSDRGQDYFHRMRGAAARMQALIRDILEFSKLKVSHRTVENVDLNVIIDQVKTELKIDIAKKKASINAKALCNVQMIPYQCHQLILNLISNSLKFSKANVPPRITITCRKVKYSKLANLNLPKLKEYCYVRVVDNGMGFEPEYSEKIFEVFQRLHAKEKYAGTGIGLAIVKKIVDNHRGVIIAKSELGKGATFDIYIPVH